jgi:hypothetical protein
MNEAIEQGRYQTVSASPVLHSVAGRDHAPPVRQLVLTDAAIEGELQAGGLHQRWRLRKLVQEQDALAILG